MFTRFLAEWRSVPQLMPLLMILVAVPAAFFTTTTAMADVWWVNETFTHGFLILPISLWLIWDQRQRISAISMAPDVRALLLLLPTLCVWLLAALIDVAVVQQLAMVALIPLTVWLLLGRPLLLALLFPLLYLFFAVPLGQSLIPPMMEFTADFTVRLIQFTGIPIYRDGLSFQLPTGNWSIVEECSGVRYLIASAALGTIYAYITYRSLTKRSLFILAALIVPILANGLRAYGIVMIGHLSGMKYAVGVDHLLYGWVFFGVVIFALFWVGGFWADSPIQEDGLSAERDNAQAPPPTFAIGTLICLLVLNLAVLAVKSTGPVLPADAQLVLPTVAGEWHRTEPEQDRWMPILSNPDLAASALYRKGADTVALDMGYFHSQREGAEAVSSLNRLSDPYDGDWNLTAQRSSMAVPYPVIETELGFGGRKVLVWSTYLVGDQMFASAARAKIYQALQLLTGERHGAFITLSTPFDAQLDDVRARLNDAWPTLTEPSRAAVASIGSD